MPDLQRYLLLILGTVKLYNVLSNDVCKASQSDKQSERHANTFMIICSLVDKA